MKENNKLEFNYTHLEREFLLKLNKIVDYDINFIEKDIDNIFKEVDNFVFKEMHTLIEKDCEKVYIKKIFNKKIISTINESIDMVKYKLEIFSNTEKVYQLVENYIYIGVDISDIAYTIDKKFNCVYSYIKNYIYHRASKLESIAISILNPELLN